MNVWLVEKKKRRNFQFNICGDKMRCCFFVYPPVSSAKSRLGVVGNIIIKVMVT